MPDEWGINEAELFAILSLIRDMLPLGLGDIHIFSDSMVAIKAIENIESSGNTAGVWNSFCPVLGRFGSVKLQWIPGHKGIDRNKRADWLVNAARMQDLEPGRWHGIDLGMGQLTLAKQLFDKEWAE